MLRDLTNPKKIDKQAVIAAIAALRAKGWDINPYTIADEMKTARTNIYRNSEIMELVNETRQQAGLPMIHIDDTASEHHESSDATHSNTASSNTTHSVKELEERIHHLENENAELQELQKDNWQRGYKAGWDEASIYLADAAPFPTEPVTAPVFESTYEAPTNDFSNLPPTDETYTSESSVDNSDFNNEFTNNFDNNTYPELPLPDYSFIDKEDNPAEATWNEEPQYTGEEAPEEEIDVTISTEELQNILKQHREKSEGDSAQGKAKGLAASKFARTPNEPPQRGFILRTVPPDIRKSCLVLGIRPEELSRQTINEAWKREITRPGTHPDQGGDSEIAVYLNTAKDVLLRWWETQEPKLGKQFGSQSKHPQAGTEEPDETEPSM